MLSVPASTWIMVVLSALLQVSIFPIAGPVPGWRSALCWCALIPFLFALLSKDREGKPLGVARAAALGYFCGVLWYLGSCSWIYQTMYLYGGLPKPIAMGILVLFALYLGIYHALFGAIVATIQRSSLGLHSALYLSPFAWVAVELARTRITGFPWDPLGNTLVDNLLVTRLAPFAGVLSLTFLVVGVNASIVRCIFLSGRRRLIFLSFVFILVIAVVFCGNLEKLQDETSFTPNNTAIMMQENLEVGVPGKQVSSLSPSQELQLFSLMSSHPEQPTKTGHLLQPLSLPPTRLDLIIWPEAPSHFQSNDPDFQAGLGTLARKMSAPIIAGSLGVDPAPSLERGYLLYDSAVLFGSSGSYQGRYDKIHLVPWGEFIPFQQFFSFAHKLTEGAGEMDRGHVRTVFRANGHAYGVFICYESIFGDEVRQFAKDGAEVLVNISDDGWYGDTGAPWQHLNMARMRAIENHRWVLRATNTGITTAIDPQGQMASQAQRHRRAAFLFPFAFTQGQTFYTRHGDWFAYLCSAITLIFCATAWLNRSGVFSPSMR